MECSDLEEFARQQKTSARFVCTDTGSSFVVLACPRLVIILLPCLLSAGRSYFAPSYFIVFTNRLRKCP